MSLLLKICTRIFPPLPIKEEYIKKAQKEARDEVFKNIDPVLKNGAIPKDITIEIAAFVVETGPEQVKADYEQKMDSYIHNLVSVVATAKGAGAAVLAAPALTARGGGTHQKLKSKNKNQNKKKPNLSRKRKRGKVNRNKKRRKSKKRKNYTRTLKKRKH